MTEIKILVNNIHDVTHRAAAETELNVYLKIGWKLQATHQNTDADNGSLMLTTVLTKADDETEKTEDGKQETKQSEDKNPVLKTGQQNTVKEVKEEKEKTKEEEEETKEAPKTSKDEPVSKEEKSETPKGFKIKEKKDDSESSEQEEGSSKASAAKIEINETEENESDEIEKFNPEEKTSEKE